ncbi:MAG TPA: ATP-binding protein [Candidatus Acidoferrales bacterium]|nr:ATP-binding protein [Candidatus Acidoferrales bacterium]
MDLSADRSYGFVAKAGGYLLVGLGVSVLAGWALRLSALVTILSGQISMKPNTALGFFFAGISIVLLSRREHTGFDRLAAGTPAVVVFIIGFSSLAEYLLHLDLHIDQLLFADRVQFPYPGRMAHITAVNFCCTGIGLFLLAISEGRAKWAQLLSLLTGFSAMLGIIGYLYGVPLLYGSIHYTSMALHTGVGFLVLSAAILYSRPAEGVMHAITGHDGGSWLARKLLPLAVIVPASLGAIYVRNGFYLGDPHLGVACLIVTQIVLFVVLVWGLAFSLNRLETERSAAQTALQHSEELFETRYRNMFEEAVVGMFQSTPDGRFLNVNMAFVRMLGYDSQAELIQKISQIDHQMYVDPTRRDEFKRLMQQDGAVQNYECQVFRKDRTKVWISANIRAVYENRVIVRYEGTSSDITQRKLLEEQLAQSQKMEAVGRLAGGVAHDFNNAIGVVVGYSALLKERVPGDANALHYTEEISKAGRRAASLTRQLLAFSRKQVIQPTILDLNSVVSDTDKMLRRLIGEDIEMTVALAGDLGRIKADRSQIEQVLMNLAVNARDAMPQGGRLAIETTNARLDKTAIAQHPGGKPGDYVALSVSDTGCGMDKETQAHIFEPFFTTKGVGKGTGLGLATVYGIIQQSEGLIWVYSEPGKGARFKLYWPRTTGASQNLPASAEEQTLPRGSETILLVEDDEALRELTSKCLVPSGYEVLKTSDGESAIRIASEFDGPIHLLLTDVVMPGLNGRELAETLRTLRPETKALYMSGYTADLVAARGVLESNVVLLEKPFTQEELLRKVRSVLDSGAETRTAAAGK